MRDTLIAQAEAIGVVLPVHDEEELLPFALGAIDRAVDALPSSLQCLVAVVLDDCGDASLEIARTWASRHDARVLRQHSANVGLARRAGCAALLAEWSSIDVTKIWLATTDADSTVPENWLTTQLAARQAGIDLWAGRVGVGDWSGHGPSTRDRWTARYSEEPGPIHGASLGFSAALYEGVGGFGDLSSGEDREIHDRAIAAGYRIYYDARAVVATSARRVGRAPNGFAAVLDTLSQEVLEATA